MAYCFTGPSDYVAWANEISFVVLGMLVAAAVRLPPIGLATILLFFGATHGYDNTAATSRHSFAA